ncbi:MAG: hypothetical protein JKY94_08755 [Rhodobacteraceae bacterium]|nr:hypothetical protein [Paracoccaceae bacterium]
MQVTWAGHGETAQRIELPASDAEVVPGVLWGAPEHFNTPAYWAVRCLWEKDNPDYVTGNEDIFRETTFCLLGGFGIKYEVNTAAFDRLDQRGFFDAQRGSVAEEVIRTWLLEPLNVSGREIRYRFPNQRARRLARMHGQFQEDEFEGLDVAALRSSLMSVEGIGPKTASWIVRNCLGSDEVAIIDVHVVRACQKMKIFPNNFKLPRDYEALEQMFLLFSEAINVRPSVLDAVIWSEIRKARTI